MARQRKETRLPAPYLRSLSVNDAVFAEKTGYPADMLDPAAELVEDRLRPLDRRRLAAGEAEELALPRRADGAALKEIFTRAKGLRDRYTREHG